MTELEQKIIEKYSGAVCGDKILIDYDGGKYEYDRETGEVRPARKWDYLTIAQVLTADIERLDKELKRGETPANLLDQINAAYDAQGGIDDKRSFHFESPSVSFFVEEWGGTVCFKHLCVNGEFVDYIADNEYDLPEYEYKDESDKEQFIRTAFANICAGKFRHF